MTAPTNVACYTDLDQVTSGGSYNDVRWHYFSIAGVGWVGLFWNCRTGQVGHSFIPCHGDVLLEMANKK